MSATIIPYSRLEAARRAMERAGKAVNDYALAMIKNGGKTKEVAE